MATASFYQRFGKRVVDVFGAAVALVVLSPLLALVWLFARFIMGTPVLFTQRRAGYLGKPFVLYKFRSMTDAHDAHGEPLPDAERLTPFGRLLRSTSVDELPGLWNVLRGDMSLIGPRPLPVTYNEYYDQHQTRRLEAMPGFAGYAALFGRNAQSWEDIFRRDVWYVDHVSFPLDLRIILGLVGVVLRREGIDRGDCDKGSPFAETLKRAALHRATPARRL
jgi:lipopolysaccharide/colanic/teichoic acid biosynthesis glycosyltransferase